MDIRSKFIGSTIYHSAVEAAARTIGHFAKRGQAVVDKAMFVATPLGAGLRDSTTTFAIAGLHRFLLGPLPLGATAEAIVKPTVNGFGETLIRGRNTVSGHSSE